MVSGDDRWASDAGGDDRFRSAADSGQPDSDGLADEETPGRRRSTDEDSVRARRFNLENADTTPRPAGSLDGEPAGARRTSDNETRRGPDDETQPSSDDETQPSSDDETQPSSDIETGPSSNNETRPSSNNETRPSSNNETRRSSNNETRRSSNNETRRSSDDETRRSSDDEAVARWRDLDDQTETTRRSGSSDGLQAPLRATDDGGLRRGPGQDGEPAARWHSLGDDLDDRLVTSADLPAAPFRIAFDDRPVGARSVTSDASIPVQPGGFDADRDEQLRLAPAGALSAGAERIDAEPAANATASEAAATESATGNATTDEEPTADDPTAESVASEAANRDEKTSEAAPSSTTVGEEVDGGAANRDVTISNVTTVEEPIASGSTAEAVASGRESGDAAVSEKATVETAAGETAVSGFLPGRRRAAIVPGTEKGGESSAPMVSGYVIGDLDDDRLVSTPVTPPAMETIGGADETTADEATAPETPVHEKPAREATVDKSTVQETPASESKVGEPTTDETLAHETPVGETPVGETTVGGATGGETTARETTVGGTTVGGTTVGGTTAREAKPDLDPAGRDAQKDVAPGAVDDKGEHPLRPGDVDETPISFWADEAVEHFRAEWHEVKADFVDDPVTALTRARDLLTDAVNELTGSLLAERDDLDPLRETATPDTESMRMAMRGYREFLDRILSL